MRTTHRIAKKRAALFSAAALSIPMVLDHAKPSLWTLQRGTARHYVYRTAVVKLGAIPRAAKWATWRAFARLATPQRAVEETVNA